MPTEAIQILHEDSRLLFVNKPPRMLAVPGDLASARDKGRSLIERLEQSGRPVFAVHRLDLDTSGVMVFAKDVETRDALIELFRRGVVEKTYVALVQGWPNPASGELKFPIRDLGAAATISARGDPALTKYATVRRVGPCALLRVTIETGRHNQIRLHFAHIGHPLVGERKYAIGRDAYVKHNRVLLHAQKLGLAPPHLSHVLRITAPLPRDYEGVLVRLASQIVTTPPPRQLGLQRPRQTPSPRDRRRDSKRRR